MHKMVRDVRDIPRTEQETCMKQCAEILRGPFAIAWEDLEHDFTPQVFDADLILRGANCILNHQLPDDELAHFIGCPVFLNAGGDVNKLVCLACTTGDLPALRYAIRVVGDITKCMSDIRKKYANVLDIKERYITMLGIKKRYIDVLGIERPDDDPIVNNTKHLLLCLACFYGRLSVAQWIVEEYDIQPVLCDLCLYYAVSQRQYDVVQWLLLRYSCASVFMPAVHVAQNALYYAICENNLPIFTLVAEYFSEYLKLFDHMRLFKRACVEHVIDIAHWILDSWCDIEWQQHPLIIYDACNTGDLKVIKHVVEKMSNGRSFDADLCFMNVCYNGTPEAIEWCMSQWATRHMSIRFGSDRVFTNACANSNLRTAKWFYEKYPDTALIDSNNEHIFIKLCHLVKPDMREWLCSLYVEPDHEKILDTINDLLALLSYGKNNAETAFWLYYKYPDLDYRPVLNNLFQSACAWDNLDLAQQLSATYEIDIHKSDDYIFRKVCETANLTTIKWLVARYPKIDICAAHNAAYYFAVTHNKRFIASWLSKQCPDMNPHEYMQYEFRRLCAGSDYVYYRRFILFTTNVLDNFLAENPGVDIHHCSEYAFRTFCASGRLDMARHLVEKYDVDIHAVDDYAFRMACAHDHIKVVAWLYGLGGISNEIVTQSLHLAQLDGHKELTELLSSYSTSQMSSTRSTS